MRKRILAEELDLTKMGLAIEYSESNAGMLGKVGQKKDVDGGVRRLQDLEGEVARLNLQKKSGSGCNPKKEKSGKSCQTCPPDPTQAIGQGD